LDFPLMFHTSLHRATFALVLALDVLLVTALVVFGQQISFLNNAIDIWFDQSDPTLPIFRHEQALFGKGSWIYVNVWASDDQQAARLSKSLTESFRHTLGIVSVLSPQTLPVLQQGEDGLSYDNLAPDLDWKSRQLKLAAHPLGATVLVRDDDPNRIGFLLEEQTDLSDGGGARQALVASLRGQLAAAPGIVDSSVTGSAVINAELNRLSWRDIVVILPLTVLVVVGVGYLLFRRKLAAILQVTLIAGVVVISTSALMLLAGNPFNMVSIALPVLLFTLAVASGMNVYQFTVHHPDLSPAEVMSSLFQPVMVSHVTTGLGFGTLATISVVPVENMAVWGSVGVLWSGLHVSVVLPTLLRISNTRSPLVDFMAQRWVVPLIERLARLAQHPAKVLGAALLVSLVLVKLISLINAGSTYLNMVAPRESMRRDYALLQQKGLPSVQLSIAISNPNSNNRVDPAFNDTLRRLSLRLERIAGVRHVIRPAEIYAEPAPVLSGGRDRQGFDADPVRVAEAYIFALTAGNQEVSRYLADDLQHFRLVLLSDYLSNSQLRDLVKNEIDPATSSLLSTLPGVSYKISGLPLLWANMDQAILSSQVGSVVSLALTCLVLFYVSSRRLLISLAATFVNVVPVAVIAGAMELFGQPLDMAAVFIIGLLLGIAIDDTSFYLHLYAQGTVNADPRILLRAVLQETAPPMLATCLMITCGFSVLMVSSFVPIQVFGLFTALGILCATLCDVLLLTLLLLMYSRRGRKV
jgi:predicted RND superfamily exporter protein